MMRSPFSQPSDRRDKITIQIQSNSMSNTELEARLIALETEVARLKAQRKTSAEAPWWEEILGSFANDPAYDEAMQLGRQYRGSLRPQVEITLAT
jgi:uncharacterized small protein (DUF1192 family)